MRSLRCIILHRERKSETNKHYNHFETDGMHALPITDRKERTFLSRILHFFICLDAGISASVYRGSKTGVYVGLMSNDYLLLQQDRENTINAYTSTSTSFCIAANRISYLLDLRGPSMTIDTACSSSLTAIHLAIHSLRTGEADIFLCGGANALLSPNTFVSLSQVNSND